ncbi:hypothetical protein AM493_11145 [Flavobacterium akiainvivens]|uniref:Outer membrane protein beta-barrel domain-containing protein n=1 Tax=Flavobacterium akiainvivens TaxID=1202724 RepID=A0A0M8MIJ7_9FLAO|nr:hypothetical protein [Flavobacterium akiainvivens]KOS06527.1 hypothetical protein AM493_11145 [Flavobacterium akiainvivens]SFQ11376.1 hypothetical protein SAMN05444144_101130 [Flavobacterium akiainvivens]
MKAITFCVVAFLCFVSTKLQAQEKETFEERAAAIATNIERITAQEQDSLKKEVDAINQKLENNQLTEAQAESQRQQYAEKRAKNIENRVAFEQEKLTQLVQDKVDGKVESKATKKFRFTIPGRNKEYSSYDSLGNHTITNRKQEGFERDFKRTTSWFLFATGLNRLVVDGDIDNDNFKERSEFYEWGFTWNTRIFKNNNLLHLRYGLSLQYNNFRPKDDKVFTVVDGQTVLTDSGLDLDMSRLRITNLVIPVHLEFDLGGKRVNGDKTYYPVQNSVRIGIGGYGGFNVKEKQILRYEDELGNDVKHKSKGGYNVNDFVYGVSGYIGYGSVSLYAKYDIQSLFDNEIDQNNVSFGIRFDLE